MDSENSLAVSLFGEILALDQLVRNRLAKVLPKGMDCLLYTSPSPRDVEESRMPSSA